MLGPDGYVAECTGENLFNRAQPGDLTTPRAGILEASRAIVWLRWPAIWGIAVVEESISRDQLYIADEIFVCGTGGGGHRIVRDDFRKIGEGNWDR